MDAKKQVVFLEQTPTMPILKIARALKLKGYETILVSENRNPKYDFAYNNQFNIKANWFKVLNPYVIQVTGSNFFSYRAKPKKIIYYAHDIWHPYRKKFTISKYSGRMIYLNSFFERKLFKSKGIIIKGSKEVFNYLDYTIKSPKIDFMPYCLDEWIVKPKPMKRNKEWHLVFVGGVWSAWEGHTSFFEIIDKITRQGIHLHIYDMYEPNEQMQEEAKRNKYFHLHKTVQFDKLSKEISKYDFGIQLDFTNPDIVNSRFSRISWSNKLFSYIEAGLPVIMSDNFIQMCDFIHKNKIGFQICYDMLPELKIFLERYSPKIKREYIIEAQERLKISKHIPRLEKFYEKVANVQ